MTFEAQQEWLRRNRRAPINAMLHITAAYAERFKCTRKTIHRVGTLRLTLCRSDEARSILIRATEQERLAAKKANRAMNVKRKKRYVDVDRLVALAFRETRRAA
jgi:hypothetical protein